MRRSLLVLLILIAIRPAHGAQQAPLTFSTTEQIQADFAETPCKNTERLAAARALFQKMGGAEAVISTATIKKVNNLVVTIPGATNETIVIGAHYDLVDSGCGAVDNWTGIVTLAHLYRSIRQFTVDKTVLLVAFDQEEKGLVGSRAMVNAIPKADISRYCAMINIDSFGLATPFALSGSSSKTLMKLADEVATAMKMPFTTIDIPNGDSDSTSFREKKIPAITLSGLTGAWQSILHTSYDQVEKVKPESVYLGYRLALAMWRRIELAPCVSYR